MCMLIYIRFPFTRRLKFRAWFAMILFPHTLLIFIFWKTEGKDRAHKGLPLTQIMCVWLDLRTKKPSQASLILGLVGVWLTGHKMSCFCLLLFDWIPLLSLTHLLLSQTGSLRCLEGTLIWKLNIDVSFLA